MTTLKFSTNAGYGTPDSRPPEQVHRDAIELAVRADELGYHSVSLSEHHFSDYVGVDGEPGANAERLAVYRRTEQPCYRCGRPIRRIVVGQRSTHFCPHCQRWPLGSDGP